MCEHRTEHWNRGVGDDTKINCPVAGTTFGPGGDDESYSYCPYCGEPTDNDAHRVDREVGETFCDNTSQSTVRHCPNCGQEAPPHCEVDTETEYPDGKRTNVTENRPVQTEPSKDSWDWLTVMEGSKVSGKDRIWFGRYDEPWEHLDEESGTVVCAEPVEHVPLPRTMSRSEIEDFLGDGWGERIINSHTSDGESEQESGQDA